MKKIIFYLITLQILQILNLAPHLPVWVIAIAMGSFLFKLIANPQSATLLKISTVIAMGGIFYYYRTLFNPEAAVSLLVLTGSFKILEQNEKRDFIISLMISLFFIAAMTLFENSLISFLKMGCFFIATLALWFHKTSKEQLKIVDAMKKTIFVSVITLPLTITLFIFFPRLTSHFFAMGKNINKNNVGYSNVVNNSTLANLSPSSTVAFRVEMKQIPNHLMYWRGTTHFITDGYNWKHNIDLNRPKIVEQAIADKTLNYKVKLEQNFKGTLFALDTPSTIQIGDRIFEAGNNNGLFVISRYKKLNYYQGESILNSTISESNANMRYLQLPKDLSPLVKKLALQLKAQTAEQTLNNLIKYLSVNKFLYSLSPGLMTNLEEFLSNKKGFCTHFASLSAIILRVNGFKTRLVSGFQGGQYNEYGKYYLVRDNDAHTWVEFLENDKWTRFDPTSFIAPERINLGGEQLFSNTDNFLFGENEQKEKSEIFKSYLKAKLYLDNLNYQWSIFIDSFDREYQQKLAKFLSIKINKFFLIIFGLPIIFLLLYYGLYKVLRGINLKGQSSIDDYYLSLLSKLRNKKQINIHPSLTPDQISNLLGDESEHIKEFLLEFERYKCDPQYKSTLKSFKKLYKSAARDI